MINHAICGESTLTIPYNGNGQFDLAYNWQTDKANGIKIRADRMDAQEQDIADGLSTAITRDGQTTVTANIPFGGNKLTGVGAATANTDAVNGAQLQKNDLTYFTATGTVDTPLITPSPAPASLTPGLSFFVRWNATNTTSTPVLRVVTGAGTQSATIANGDLTPVESGQLVADGVNRVTYGGTVGWLLPNKGAANSWGLANGGIKSSNFTASGGNYYTVYPPTTGLVAQMENSSTAAGKFIMFVKIGPWPMYIAGTINGQAGTIAIDQRQTLPVSCTTVDGWV